MPNAQSINYKLETVEGVSVRNASIDLTYSDFTKSTQYGIKTLTNFLPAGCFYIGCKVEVTEAFDGGTNNLKIGKTNGQDEFCNGENLDLSSVADIGAEAEDALEWFAADTDVYLRIDEGSNWDDVTAGKMTLNMYYISTNPE